jgi:hypothetical protein
MEYETNEQLKIEVKEFVNNKFIINKSEENIMIYFGYAQHQIKQDYYRTPCEDCDNPNCKDEIRIWYCPNQM